jgi:hypothetical protein
MLGWKVLLDANQFGAGAHFVALGGHSALLALGDGSFTAVL